MSIKETVKGIVDNSTGHSVQELETLRAALSEQAQGNEQAQADLQYLEGYLEAPGAILADLAAIARKHQS